MQFFIGLAFLVVGIMAVIKTDWFLGFMGRNDWAEENLGSYGGSRFMYKLIGMLFCFFGILGMTGLLQGLAGSIAGLLFGARSS